VRDNLRFATCYLLLAICYLLLALPALAQTEVSPTEAMLRANQQYEAGQYTAAAEIYEAILDAGLHNSDLYYNLGNAYFKQGEVGRAILNYRRAQRLSPRDADIAANLDFARRQTADRLENNTGSLANLAQATEAWLTLNEAVMLALFVWVLICYFAVLAILLPRQRRIFTWIIGVLALLLAMSVVSISNRLYNEWQYPPAVVVARQIDITSGPGSADQYVVNFTLHAGAEVRLLESRPGWRRVALPGDLQGWAPVEAVTEVNDLTK
jgi:tetratricopeptide (TPR) repeat protein